MTSSPFYPDPDLELDNGALLSPTLAQAALDYMRSSSPESGEQYGPGNLISGFLLKPVFIEAASSNSGSPYLLSCPPSWLFQDAQGEYDNLQPDVPLSSSPPDITSSSPQSFGSEKRSSSATSATSAYFSDYVSSSQQNPSLVDFVPVPSTEGFGYQLHQLLLVALKERGIESSPGNTFIEPSRSGSPVNRRLEDGSTADRTQPTFSAGSSPDLVSKWFYNYNPQVVSQLDMVQEFLTPPSRGPFPLSPSGSDEISPIEFGSANSKYAPSSTRSGNVTDNPKA